MGRPGITMTDRDDPQGRARAIADQWSVTERLRLGVQHGNRIRACWAEEMRKGDWVDVRAAFDITSFKDRDGDRRIEVRLRPLTIIQLLPYSKVPATLPQAVDEYADAGFTFDDDGEDVIVADA